MKKFSGLDSLHMLFFTMVLILLAYTIFDSFYKGPKIKLYNHSELIADIADGRIDSLDDSEKVYFTICRDTLTESHYLSFLIRTDSNYWGAGTMFGDGGEDLKQFSMTKGEMRKILNHRD